MSLATFRRLHDGPDLLILANCWDAGTARMVADQGARALATSSAAVAWSHGYADGDRLPVQLLLSTTRAIAALAQTNPGRIVSSDRSAARSAGCAARSRLPHSSNPCRATAAIILRRRAVITPIARDEATTPRRRSSPSWPSDSVRISPLP